MSSPTRSLEPIRALPGEMSVSRYPRNGQSPFSVSSKLSTPQRIEFAFPGEPLKDPATTLKFIDCVKPVYFGAKTAFLLPFTLIYTTSGDLKSCELRRIDKITYVLSILLSIILTVLNCLSFDIVDDARANIMLVGRRIVLLCALSLTIVYFTFDLLNRYRFVNIVKTISGFDKKVTIHPSNSSNKCS